MIVAGRHLPDDEAMRRCGLRTGRRGEEGCGEGDGPGQQAAAVGRGRRREQPEVVAPERGGDR